MQRAFGNSPWRLKSEDVPTLKGMAAVHGDHGWDENPFERLIEEIERLDEIEVWAEW